MLSNGSTKKSLVDTWKNNKMLSLCVMIGLVFTILFYAIFREVLWMGMVCLFIGVIGLYRKMSS